MLKRILAHKGHMASAEQASETVESPSYVTKDDLAAFGKSIADGIATGFKATTRPKVSIGEYQARHRRKVRLNKEVYQNGGLVRLENISDAEVGWLNRLHRPGRYINRKVEVIVKNDDPDNIVVYLRYSDRAPDQRFENAKHFKDFEELVKKIVLEQDVIEENERIREEKLAKL